MKRWRIRPACLSDVVPARSGLFERSPNVYWWAQDYLRMLYDSEWQRRGYLKSP
jgi:hypothetical protein